MIASIKLTLKKQLRTDHVLFLVYFILKAARFYLFTFPTRMYAWFVTRGEYQKRFHGKSIGILQAQAVGPLALAEIMLRELDVKNWNPRTEAVLIAGMQTSNHQLFKMFERVVPIERDEALYQRVDQGGRHYLKSRGVLINDCIANGTIFFPQCPLHLHFTDDEVRFGEALLAKIGLRPGERFVALHNRDSVYWEQRRNRQEPWNRYRNSDFKSLLPVIEHLRQKGIRTVRSGDYVDEQVECYCSLNRLSAEEKDFMDIFIQKTCLFSICGGSGIGWIPYLFKTPVLFHNLIPLGESPAVENGVILPKLLRWRSTGRLLTLSEMIHTKRWLGYAGQGHYWIRKVRADQFQDAAFYEEYGIEVVDNQPEEIIAAVDEMVSYLEGNLRLTAEQQALQQQFRQAFPLGHPMRHFIGLVSPAFLERFWPQIGNLC